MEKSKSKSNLYQFLNRKSIVFCLLIFSLLYVTRKMITTYNNIITSYNVLAKSERIDIITKSELNSKWNITNAKIYKTTGEIVEEKFNGSIDVYDSVKIELERISLGNLSIRFYSLKNGPSISYSMDDIVGVKVEMKDDVEIVINDIKSFSKKGITYVFPFEGEVHLGRVSDKKGYGDGNAVLRNGVINMLGKNILEENAYFQGETENLRLGDRLIFPDTCISFGIININEEPAMNINYRTESKEAWITKPGMLTGKYKISVSLFDQWRYDKDFQRLSMAGALLLVITSLFTFIFDALNFFKPIKQ